MSEFAQRTDAFLDEFFRLDPISATAAGMHAHDGRWPDLTETGRAERLAFLGRWETEFRTTADADLTSDERIDRHLLLIQLDSMRFMEAELREETWDPLAWVYLLGGGIFPLLTREFAPLAERLTSVASRLEGMPELLSTARTLLGSRSDRPASRLHTETALTQLLGIADLADNAVRDAEAASPSDPDVAVILARVREAARFAKAALGRFEKVLRDEILPMSEGEGRLGPDLFRTKMRHTLKSDTPTPEQILARAEQECATVRAEMVRIAREIWPAWMPDRTLPDEASLGSREAADAQTVRAVLDAIGRDHPAADAIVDTCRNELVRIEEFCRKTDLIGLADEPLDIEWTPIFLRAFAGAMLISPGPLDRGQKTFFGITPVADDWTPEQVESYLREDNDRMLRLLTIHEAVPGHYLQAAYANRCPSVPRTVFWSGVFAEGWAVYVTQVMLDVGYEADDPALRLVHWKFYLRSATNAIIDVKIHTQGMTEDEAVSLMIDGGFQEEAEARNKYRRARLSSTQLSTYFVGSMEMWELERERRRRLAIASGDPRGAAAVPEPLVVGGFGETPGFRYREHLEEILGHGAPPMSLLRRIILG